MLLIALLIYAIVLKNGLIISFDEYDLPDGIYHATIYDYNKILIRQYNREIYGTLTYSHYDFKAKVHIKNKRIINIEE